MITASPAEKRFKMATAKATANIKPVGMGDLVLGALFQSFEQLQESVNRYSEAYQIKLFRADSHRLRNPGNRLNTDQVRLVPPALEYVALMYGCNHGGTCKSRSRGIRPRQRYLGYESKTVVLFKASTVLPTQ